MDASNVNIDLIRSHVDTIILRSLCDEDKYGYEILNEIKEKSKGLYMLKQPTLYSCLKRLEKLGYIRSYKGDVSNGAQRVYYSLQPEGRAFLESDQVQWEFSRTIIDNLLSDREFDPNSIPPFDPTAYRPMTKRQRNPHSYAEYLASLSEPDDVSQPVQDDLADARSAEYYSQPEPQPEIDDSPAIEPTEEQPGPEPVEEARQEPVRTGSSSSYGSILDIFRPKQEEPREDVQPAPERPAQTAPSRDSYRQPEQERPTKQAAPVFDMRDEEAGVNYITSFDSIYSAPKNDVREYTGSADRSKYDVSADQFGFVSLNELRTRYAAEGYTIRPYIKKNTSEFYINNYYYSGRLLRDCSLFAYALYAVEVLIAYFATGVRSGQLACRPAQTLQGEFQFAFVFDQLVDIHAQRIDIDNLFGFLCVRRADRLPDHLGQADRHSDIVLARHPCGIAHIQRAVQDSALSRQLNIAAFGRLLFCCHVDDEAFERRVHGGNPFGDLIVTQYAVARFCRFVRQL